MPLKAVIFDFDGLMVDTEWPAFEAWTAIYREHGAELALERWVACVGTQGGFDPCAHLKELCGRPVDAAALLADKERRKASICSTLPLMPGVAAVNAEARALQLGVAVASSYDAAWVHGHLRRLDLFTTLDAILTRDDVARVKPHPDLYLAAAARLAVQPGDCLVLEDSLNGVLAARAAGARCIAVPNRVTGKLDFNVADARLTSLTELRLATLGNQLWNDRNGSSR
jgi:HAD superfamily hydrolase (TIGR01509 family)